MEFCFILSTAFSLCFQLHCLLSCQLQFLCLANFILFVLSTAFSFVLSVAVPLCCQLHFLCVFNYIFFFTVNCIFFVLSTSFIGVSQLNLAYSVIHTYLLFFYICLFLSSYSFRFRKLIFPKQFAVHLQKLKKTNNLIPVI